ncbi:MAG TPA: tripartite tricarboxylate transporter substrate binding protein, partial [Burkholderiales bacterium]|nr:tripartite tricarboxylate transporter substrate binding protein [Burkholderiales bacterium]
MKKLFTFAALALIAGHALAQYPNKAVHVIVSFTPGSSTDIVGRIVMAKVSEYWGQPVVVENRGGA